MSQNIKLNGQTYTGISEVELPLENGTAKFKDEDEIVIPSGTKTINSNGTHNVSDYEYAEVNVPTSEPDLENITITANGTYESTDHDGYGEVVVNVPTSASGEIEITENGEHDVSSYATAKVNVPAPDPALETKSITQNGTYTPSAGYDGFSSVIVNVAGSAPWTKVTTEFSIGDSITPRVALTGSSYFRKFLSEETPCALFVYAGDFHDAPNHQILFVQTDKRRSTSETAYNNLVRKVFSDTTPATTSVHTVNSNTTNLLYCSDTDEYYMIPITADIPEVSE